MRFRFFVAMCLLGGVGGFVGSAIGGLMGGPGVFIGGFLGGIAIAPIAARVAVWRRWIAQHQFWATAAGAAIGFVAAAVVAVNTLSSPIGPILSTSLTGIGALVGSGRARESNARAV